VRLILCVITSHADTGLREEVSEGMGVDAEVRSRWFALMYGKEIELQYIFEAQQSLIVDARNVKRSNGSPKLHYPPILDVTT
jgi:hypothetical protein